MKKLIFIMLMIPSLAFGLSREEIASRKAFQIAKKAVRSNNFEILHGIDLDLIDKSENTLLMVACGDSGANLDMIKYLVGEGIGIDFRANSGHTALSIAMKKGDPEIIRYLLSEGADWTTSDKSNIININDLELVKLFVFENIDIDIQDKHGFTALMRAAINNNYDMLVYLLENNADINLVSEDGLTALGYATQRNYTKIIDILKTAQDNY